jgi:hypothetical protein
MAMDVDDDGTPQAAKANDFGIEPDFDALEKEDKEVGAGDDTQGCKDPRLTRAERRGRGRSGVRDTDCQDEDRHRKGFAEHESD